MAIFGIAVIVDSRHMTGWKCSTAALTTACVLQLLVNKKGVLKVKVKCVLGRVDVTALASSTG